MNFNCQISSGCASLAAKVVGSGNPVIFLHAAVCDSRMWCMQLHGVSASSKAVTYDRRGFGKTHAEKEDFSAVADLVAVMDAVASDSPAILVGCSQGGRIAVETALQHPSRVRGLVLIAPSVPGAAEPIYPLEISDLISRQRAAERRGDLDAVNAIKAHLWLDGPLQSEGRVTGQARQLFLDMNGIALRAPPTGANVDIAPAIDRLSEISVPSLVIWGDLDFPHIQERSRRIAMMLVNGSGHALTGTAHLPSLDQAQAVTRQLTAFLHRCSDLK